MDVGSAKRVARAIAILDFVGAAFLLIFAAGIITAAVVILGDEVFASAPGILWVALVVAIVAVAIGCCFLGYGMWKFKNWARITHIVLAWLSAVIGFLGLVFSIISVEFMGAGPEIISGLSSNLVSIGMAAFVIWFLQFEKTVVALFTGGPLPAGTAPDADAATYYPPNDPPTGQP